MVIIKKFFFNVHTLYTHRDNPPWLLLRGCCWRSTFSCGGVDTTGGLRARLSLLSLPDCTPPSGWSVSVWCEASGRVRDATGDFKL